MLIYQKKNGIDKIYKMSDDVHVKNSEINKVCESINITYVIFINQRKNMNGETKTGRLKYKRDTKKFLMSVKT